MPYEFLSRLDLSPEEETKLAAVGAKTPSLLLSIIRHAGSREAFIGLFGEERSREIENRLAAIASPEPQTGPLHEWTPALGAVAPAKSGAPDNGPERQRLVRAIQELRADPSPENRRRAAELEERLMSLL